MIFMLSITGYCLSFVVSYLGIASAVAKAIINSGMSRYLVLTLVYVLWLILGCLMNPTSVIIITVPFIFPALVRLGFDPLWMCVVGALCVEIGMITPPIGWNLFVLRANTGLSMGKITAGAIPYVIVLIIGLAILTVFPQIALVIPSGM